jgi:hypothetical protein
VIGVGAVVGFGAQAPLSSFATESTETRLELLAAPSSSGTAIEGQPLTVRVTLSNPGSTATSDLSVEFRLDGTRPASRDDLAEWFGESAAASPTLDESTVAARASVTGLNPGASAVLDLTVAARSPLWSGPFGPRLGEVVVSEAGEWLAVDRTAVVRVPANSTPPSTATTFVQPLTTPGEASGLLSAETLATATAESGVLSRALTASAGRPVLLGIDPRVVVSIAALGDQAPPSALAFLERVRSAPNENFLLSWADADPLASIDAQRGPLPEPEGTGQLADGSLAADANAAGQPSASPSEDPDDPAEVESTVAVSDLLDWTPTFDGFVWAESAGLSSVALDTLASEGTRTVVTPSSQLSGASPVQRYGELVLVRADSAVADAAREAAAAPSQQRFDRAMARISSLLAATAVAQPGAPVVISLGREATRTSDRLLDTLAQTISLPWATASTVSSALSLPATDATIIDAPASDSRRASVTAALNAETADRQFAQIATNPAVITDVRRLDLLAALSLGWGDSSASALQAYVADSARLRSSVRVVESSAILLLTDRATIPVTVQNDLDVAVRVYVRVEPDSAQLRVLDPNVETVVEPRSQSRTLVPVESLTNGDVNITVTVRDAQGEVLSEPTRVALSLQAGWETAGTIIAGVAVAVLFVVGITRDLRKRRRRMLATDNPDDPVPAEPAATQSAPESIR